MDVTLTRFPVDATKIDALRIWKKKKNLESLPSRWFGFQN